MYRELRKIMKKVILFAVLFCSYNDFFSQDANVLVGNFLKSSNSLAEMIYKNVPEDKKESFYNDLSTLNSPNDFNNFSLTYFGPENSEKFISAAGQFEQDALKVSKLNLSKDELGILLKQNRTIDMFYCRNLGAYEKCMAPANEKLDNDTEDFYIEFGGAVATIVVTDGWGAYAGLLAGIGAARKYWRNMDQHQRAMEDCYGLHCK